MRPNRATIVKPGQAANVSANVGVVYADCMVRASWQIVTSDAVNGAFKVQASNDMPVGVAINAFVPTNWNDITSATVTLSGTGLVGLIPSQELSYAYLRIVFTDASGGTSAGSYSINMSSIGF